MLHSFLLAAFLAAPVTQDDVTQVTPEASVQIIAEVSETHFYAVNVTDSVQFLAFSLADDSARVIQPIAPHGLFVSQIPTDIADQIHVEFIHIENGKQVETGRVLLQTQRSDPGNLWVSRNTTGLLTWVKREGRFIQMLPTEGQNDGTIQVPSAGDTSGDSDSGPQFSSTHVPGVPPDHDPPGDTGVTPLPPF